jgi:hypothetical protein
VIRHVDAGYPQARQVAEATALNIPSGRTGAR